MQISLGLFIGVAVALALIVGIITHFVTVLDIMLLLSHSLYMAH